jgi:hypothetical protein
LSSAAAGTTFAGKLFARTNRIRRSRIGDLNMKNLLRLENLV